MIPVVRVTVSVSCLILQSMRNITCLAREKCPCQVVQKKVLPLGGCNVNVAEGNCYHNNECDSDVVDVVSVVVATAAHDDDELLNMEKWLIPRTRGW